MSVRNPAATDDVLTKAISRSLGLFVCVVRLAADGCAIGPLSDRRTAIFSNGTRHPFDPILLPRDDLGHGPPSGSPQAPDSHARLRFARSEAMHFISVFFISGAMIALASFATKVVGTPSNAKVTVVRSGPSALKSNVVK